MSHLCLLGVATLTLTSAGFAGSDTNADLQARLEAAEARISELSAAANTNWLNDARADEIRGLVHDVLADADTRASLQGSGATAGYNGGFTVGSADGNWSLTINGVLQERWVHIDVDDGTDSLWGFQNARTILNFSGTVAGDFGYDIRTDWSSGIGRTEWAYGTWDFGNGWGLAAGTMKLPMSREWLIKAENQLAVERSWFSDDFGTRMGVAVNYVNDDIRFTAMFSNENAGVNGAIANGSGSNLTARVEWMVEGSSWNQFDQFTSPIDGPTGTLIGLSYNHQDDGWDGGIDTDGDIDHWVIDAQIQLAGNNLYVSYQRMDDDDTGFNPTTFEIMYGIYVADDWEFFGRWTDYDADGAVAAPVLNMFNTQIFTIGLTHYMAGQNAKWTTDISWASDGMFADAITGWDSSSALGAEDQTMIRTQLQFAF